ncbi:dTDP-4-amino-4,6-dideoxygalactose transaminase [Faecalibaculum rodentium]|uniref:dTDP-4-amino-4,6-dideoxygalactose transaminase n=2 Tax=Faecalibaculum rodentium TaxID=1702221 RepID=UPI001C3D9B99|nr:dTDP-4-amino-4,6-dideoxygalactose transaminase [Faecalibaculum rodentium]
MHKFVDFNVPPFVGREIDYIQEAVKSKKISGDGTFTKKCSNWLENRFNAQKVLLTTSGSSALDMAFLLSGIKSGDEVIMPSYTFSSTANSAILAGANIVFVDIDPKTMNIDPDKVKKAITNRTKVICCVHYAGVACDMAKIMDIAKKNNLIVIEDAAQAVMASYKNKALGTIGDFGCYSFHETKNYSMGEGGALLINNSEFNEKAEILREKGTNRSKFFRGQVDKYTWVDFGDSYLPSDLNAAYLYAQLEEADRINSNRLTLWNIYYNRLKKLEDYGLIELPFIPNYCQHNAHIFYIKLHSLEERTAFISFMRINNISTPFHYVPLHSAPAGKKYGKFHESDLFTTEESNKLVRLPLYFNMDRLDIDYVIKKIYEYFGEEEN